MIEDRSDEYFGEKKEEEECEKQRSAAGYV